MTDNYKNVIFFDGVCSLCQAWVRFVIKRDKIRKLHFSSLQSEFAQSKISLLDNLKRIDSIIYYSNGHYHVKSSAVLHILKDLGGVWYPAFILIIIPRFIRDSVYDIIARKRYSWFGKSNNVCESLGKEEMKRVI